MAYHLAHAFPAAVERLVLVAAGVCLEEADLAAGLFAVEDIAEAASLLLPQRPEDLRRLVGLTFCRPPRFMPSCFIRDYIRVGNPVTCQLILLLFVVVKSLCG